MDIFSVNSLWDLFPVFWLGGIGAWFTLAYVKLKYNPTNEQMQQLVLLIMAVIASVILAASYIGHSTHAFVRDAFLKRMGEKIPEIVFKLENKEVRLSQEQDIRAFQAIFKNRTDVGAHHSSVIREIAFSFGKDPKEYRMGKDSTNPDEFWLRVMPCPDFGNHEWNILQFHSSEMTQFLGKISR
ncbi:MAG: hypothetical protein HQM08_09565 [Candidatus Riflebacteria bacterium]|nr:hypothetical protein [Candidatus Riflebacteria bacterium]